MKRKVLIDDCIYTLSKGPKFRVFMNGDIYESYVKPSRTKVNAYKGNYIWFNGCDKDEKCKWYGVQSHNCQHFSVAFSCLAEDLDTGEMIRVMLYNTGMNVYVWQI